MNNGRIVDLEGKERALPYNRKNTKIKFSKIVIKNFAAVFLSEESELIAITDTSHIDALRIVPVKYQDVCAGVFNIFGIRNNIVIDKYNTLGTYESRLYAHSVNQRRKIISMDVGTNDGYIILDNYDLYWFNVTNLDESAHLILPDNFKPLKLSIGSRKGLILLRDGKVLQVVGQKLSLVNLNFKAIDIATGINFFCCINIDEKIYIWR